MPRARSGAYRSFGFPFPFPFPFPGPQAQVAWRNLARAGQGRAGAG
ncbi:MAG: hypothetical protein OSB70_05140 [Myxococcota bacterium]|nr:hypothetical protein [Myxococcota bacterium]